MIVASTAAGATEWTAHSSGGSGIGVELPADWKVQQNSGSDGPAMQAMAADQNAIVLVFAGTAQELGTDNATELVKMFSDKLTAKSTDVQVLRDIAPFDAGGQAGASRVLQGTVSGQTGVITFSSVSYEGRVALLMGVDKNGAGSATGPSPDFEHIAQSLRVVAAEGASEEDRSLMRDQLAAIVGPRDKPPVAFVSSLRRGMTCEQVQQQYPKLDIRTCRSQERSHTFPEIHIDNDPLVSHLRLTFKDGGLTGCELHFHTFLNHELLKEVTLEVFSATWGQVSPEKRDKDIIVWRDRFKNSASRAFSVNHWRLSVEFPQA